MLDFLFSKQKKERYAPDNYYRKIMDHALTRDHYIVKGITIPIAIPSTIREGYYDIFSDISKHLVRLDSRLEELCDDNGDICCDNDESGDLSKTVNSLKEVNLYEIKNIVFKGSATRMKLQLAYLPDRIVFDLVYVPATNPSFVRASEDATKHIATISTGLIEDDYVTSLKIGQYYGYNRNPDVEKQAKMIIEKINNSPVIFKISEKDLFDYSNAVAIRNKDIDPLLSLDITPFK